MMMMVVIMLLLTVLLLLLLLLAVLLLLQLLLVLLVLAVLVLLCSRFGCSLLLATLRPFVCLRPLHCVSHVARHLMRLQGGAQLPWFKHGQAAVTVLGRHR